MSTELIELLSQVKRLLEEQKASKEQKESKPSIDAFCDKKGISRSLFYKLKLPYAKAGARSITTPETEAAWQRRLAASTKSETG